MARCHPINPVQGIVWSVLSTYLILKTNPKRFCEVMLKKKIPKVHFHPPFVWLPEGHTPTVTSLGKD